MDVVFKGFQSAVPLWLILVLFVISGSIAWWSYKNIQIPPSYRYLLVILRSSAFFILLALLTAPFFVSTQSYLKEPEVLVFLDNSKSTSIQKGNYNGTESYRKLLNDLAFGDKSNIQFRFFTMDDSLKSHGIDSLNMKGNQTNLSVITTAIRNNEEAKTAILISDGIYTQGRNPLFQLTASDIPVQTIALGDTTEQKDIYIKNIATNETGYLNTSQPAEVTVVQNGFNGQNLQVRLINNGQLLDAKTVSMAESPASKTITFNINHGQTGLQQFEIAIPALQDEWTKKNNEQSFSIDVLDNKQRILSLAFEIHPDVRLIRSLLAEDKNTTLISRTWLGGNRFIEGDFTVAADTLDLVILHGYPESGLTKETKDKLAQYFETVPLIVMATPRLSYSAIDTDFSSALPVNGVPQAPSRRVTPQAAVQSTAHPIMDLPALDDESLPSLFAPISRIDISPGSELLFESQFQGNSTSSPLLVVQQIGNQRRAQITAFGWYKLKQSSSESIRLFAEQLLLNVVSWTATKPDTRNLTITPSQKLFEDSDAIILNGFLKDERGKNESDAQIEVELSGGNDNLKNYSMRSFGDGHYQLTINPLPEGIYTFNATAKKGERIIGEHRGQFSVTSSNAEFINTKRNDELLTGIAQKTGGAFYEIMEAAKLWEDLENKKMLIKEEKVTENLFYPNQHLFWFIIVILLLASEWSIRKYFALP